MSTKDDDWYGVMEEIDRINFGLGLQHEYTFPLERVILKIEELSGVKYLEDEDEDDLDE